MGIKHFPVLLREVIKSLSCKKDGIYIDATIGSGGHALELLKRHPDIGMLVGIDQDAEAVALAKKNLRSFQNRVVVFQENFINIEDILNSIGICEIDGILFDLGCSTLQLKNPLRGFSFNLEGPLDMRMDQHASLQAKDLIRELSVLELERVLREYGEERWAKLIARHIHRYRVKKPIEYTMELSEIVLQAIPRKCYPKKIHPATKTFQALRIAVNDELANLQKGLEAAGGLLKRGGRLCVISFHSLEDRIAKHTLKQWEKGCICPARIPVCTCGREAKRMKIITKKPILPSAQEISKNPSSRSARLRVGERL